MVLVSLLIRWKNGARTLNQSLSEVMQNQSNSLITFVTQFDVLVVAVIIVIVIVIVVVVLVFLFQGGSGLCQRQQTYQSDKPYLVHV